MMLSNPGSNLGRAAPRLARLGRQCFTTGANGVYRLPPFQGEPSYDYEPGSVHRKRLQQACAELRNRAESGNPIEIPCIVNGREIFTGDVREQRMPGQHGTVIARFHHATPAVMKEATEAALAAQKVWGRATFSDRAGVFRRAADLVSETYRYDLMAAVMLGTGKTVWQAEIDASVELADFWRLNCNFAEQLYQLQPPLNSPGVWNRMEYRPLEGFVAAISPFNFLAIGGNLPGAPALMGNPVVWKPSDTAVLGNYMLMNILKEAGLPEGVINFLPSSGPEFGKNVIPHPELSGLHFTGSTGVFNHLWAQVGTHLADGKYKAYPRVVGETGGKNFHLIHESANLENALFNTIRGAFEFQGQKCSATSRAYIPDSMWPEFKRRLQEELPQVKVGQPDEFDSFMSAVIDRTSFEKLENAIARARADPENCEIIHGGRCDSSRGWFVEPTVIKVKDPQHFLMTTELFGPVLAVYEYPAKDFDSVLELVGNTGQYGLTGSLFAQDVRVIAQASEALCQAAGNFYINDKSTGAVVGEQPFGGARQSGTNDKAGSVLNLLRWVSPRSIKENSLRAGGWRYPHMEPENSGASKQ